MKVTSLIWKIFKFLFIWLVIYAIAIALCVYFMNDQESAVWLGITIASFLLLSFLAVRLITYFYQRMQAKERVRKLVHVDKTGIEKRRTIFGFWTDPLQKRLRSIFKYIKNSNLAANGDPFYTLPWYLVLGKDGASRHHFLTQSKLRMPDVHCPALLSATSNEQAVHQDFNWWLSETAVYIDVADIPDRGLISKQAEGTDRFNFWKILSRALRNKRERKPIDGLILLIDVDDFLNVEAQQVRELAHRHKEAVLYLMSKLQVRFPCYVVISHSHKIPGFSSWLHMIHDKKKDQTLGLLWEESWDNKKFINKLFSNITTFIDESILELLATQKINTQADAINLTNHLRKLQSGFKTYTDTLCQSNPYQETPLLRGMFFTAFAETSNHALLANRLLSSVIPYDQCAVRLLNYYKRKLTLTKRIVMGSWFSLSAFAICMMVIISWRHLNFLQSSYQAYSDAYDLSRKNLELVTNINSTNTELFETNIKISQLSNMEKLISSLDQEINQWHIYWFIFENDFFIDRLKSRFLNHIKTNLTEELDHAFLGYISERLNLHSESNNEDAFGDVLAQSIQVLVRRINLFEAAINGASYQQLAELPPAFADDIYFDHFPRALGSDTEVIKNLNHVYSKGLFWHPEVMDLQAELDEIYKLVELFLRNSDNNMSWLISWANQTLLNKDFKLEDYWSGSGSQVEAVQVDPAYTLAGKELIDDFLHSIYLRYNDESGDSRWELEQYKKNFQQYYKANYLRQWENMALSLHSGKRLLRGQQEWLAEVQTLAVPGRSPFMKLLRDLEQQLTPFKDISRSDSEDMYVPLTWYDLIYLYKEFKEYTEADKGQKSTSAANIVIRSAERAGGKLKSVIRQGKNVSRGLQGLGVSDNDMNKIIKEGSLIVESYETALRELALDADIKKRSLKATENFFKNPDDPRAWDSPEGKAYEAIKKMQFLLGKPSVQTEAFWKLLTGPLALGREFMVKESEVELNQIWQSEFLAEIDSVPDFKKLDLVFGDGHLLDNFIDQYLGNFLEKSAGSGIRITRAQNYAIGFHDAFLYYIVHGRESYRLRKENFKIQFEAFPAQASRGALYSPVRTELSLQCETRDKQTISNINIKSAKVFVWSSDCRQIDVDIDMGIFSLRKTYAGADAMLVFLQSLQNKELMLQARDFPEYTNDLLDIGVRYIVLKYHVANRTTLLNALQTAPVQAPDFIASGW